MSEIPKVGEMWQHVKRRTLYRIIAIATIQMQNEYDGGLAVVYVNDTNNAWVRPLVDFCDGRFIKLGDAP